MSVKDPTNVPEVLVLQEVITEEQLSEAKNISLATGKKVEDVLLEKGVVTKLDIIKAKSYLFGIPYINLDKLTNPKELAGLIPREESLRSKIIVFDKSELGYKVAMANPLDIQTIRWYEQKLGSRIQVHIAEEEDLISKINLVSSDTITNEVKEIVGEAVNEVEKIDLGNLGEGTPSSFDIQNAPAVKIINKIIEVAIQTKASDIHIEPTNDALRVRYRINGLLEEKVTLPKQILSSLVARIKILSKLQIDEKRKPQDGRFEAKTGNIEVDLRVSTLPTVLGEKVVIRLLRKDIGILKLEDTGMRGNALKIFKEGLKSTTGIIYITGPTGSGKTVTVASSMHILNKPEVNIVSIEDPVEIRVPGVNQVQVNVDAGLTFAAALRAFLRQDPDIIIVGETRDEETARLSAQASLTGHLVLSTLHTNSAAGALPRLLDMGIEPYIITSSVNVCAAQRLCRRICKNCIEAHEVNEYELIEIRRVLSRTRGYDEQKLIEYQQRHVLGNQNPTGMEKLVLFKGKGCEKCNWTGYSGRIGIFEVFKLSEKIGSLVMKHASSEEIARQAIEEGMITMAQDGFLKAIEGITTIEEVQRVISA